MEVAGRKNCLLRERKRSLLSLPLLPAACPGWLECKWRELAGGRCVFKGNFPSLCVMPREGTARSPGSAHPSDEWVQPPGCHSRSAVAGSDTANLCTTEAGRGLGPGRAENCTCTCTLFKGRKKKRRGKGEYKAKQCAQHPPKTDKGHRRKKINFKEANLPILKHLSG